MEGSQAGPPPGLPGRQPLGQALPGEGQRPATAEQVNGLRRWAIVAGVWAVAATALAVIALLKPEQERGPDPAAAAANRSIDRLEGRLRSRFQRLEDRVGLLPNGADLEKLSTRIQRVESRVGQAADAGGVRDSINELQNRVEKVQEAQRRESRAARRRPARANPRAGR